jgi:hypothetical protein
MQKIQQIEKVFGFFYCLNDKLQLSVFSSFLIKQLKEELFLISLTLWGN